MDDERNQPPQRPPIPEDGAPSFEDSPFDDGAAPRDGRGPEGGNAADEKGADIDYERNRRLGPNVPNGPFGPDVTQISTATRAGWIALGVVLGPFGLLVALVLYRQRDPIIFWASLRYVLIGAAIGIILELLLIQALIDGSAAMQAAGPGSPGWTSANF